MWDIAIIKHFKYLHIHLWCKMLHIHKLVATIHEMFFISHSYYLLQHGVGFPFFLHTLSFPCSNALLFLIYAMVGTSFCFVLSFLPFHIDELQSTLAQETSPLHQTQSLYLTVHVGSQYYCKKYGYSPAKVQTISFKRCPTFLNLQAIPVLWTWQSLFSKPWPPLCMDVLFFTFINI